MRPTLLTLITAAALLLPGPADAMRIRTQVSLVAWSSDGKSALLRESQDGPEGGGSAGFLVVSTSKSKVLRVVISSDFSPGGGSRPQMISASQCQAELAQLARVIKRAKFKGITLLPDGCKGKYRSVLKVSVAAQKAATASVLGRGKHVLVDGKFDLHVRKGKVQITTPRKKLIGEDKLTVSRAKGGKVLLVLHTRQYGDTVLAGIYHKEKGRYHKVALPRGKGGL